MHVSVPVSPGNINDSRGTDIVSNNLAQERCWLECHVKSATEFLNHREIPVVACDQRIFAIAKYAQWKWSETHGKKQYVVMLGGLHTEMALCRVCGDMLDRSGWTVA